ncbi:MAG TPA: efflux RND transporter periplasmic adaptor subunit [Ideonella sp.]|uniref:efflux RND transporter periplasmic adaptor subunit n=1 Tax=Ideonella sp. TaxID=1929293 RepID=UPI002E353CFB|nr:efflux RND transporter periplasmic adaptor subunit [Ideonella sp.]HEX5685133.1 efflux RND transporter periplasmic adaptor subunit [Ideonella sp.]
MNFVQSITAWFATVREPFTALGRALHLAALGLAVASTHAAAPGAAAPPLATAPVVSSSAAGSAGWDGVVQAVRQTTVSAQVSGAVVALDVRAGDTVKAGQVLARLDARAAEQTAAAGAAQAQAARAAQDEATKEFARQQQLYEQRYISRAALDRAEAQFKSAQAQAGAQLASAGAARTQSGFYVVKAPYAGVVADVAVVLGDMAMPGTPLLTLYDPLAMRISVAVPQTVATRWSPDSAVQVELPGLPGGHRVTPSKARLLPAADPATHTLELQLDLPASVAGVRPGMFARAWLPGGAGTDTGAAAGARLYVPARAVVARSELTAVYVVAADGRVSLRQVRRGAAVGEQVEVLAGVSAGERVALDPQAAARATTQGRTP